MFGKQLLSFGFYIELCIPSGASNMKPLKPDNYLYLRYIY